MAASQGPAQRIFTAGRRLLGSLLASGETRLRLAVLELEEERARLVGMLLIAGLALILLLLGIAVLTTLVIVFFWDSYRLTAIAVSAGVLLSSGLLLCLRVMQLARRRTLLASTLKHLATDRELLEQERKEGRHDS
ncbi:MULTISPECIES: phage holin family protein [unclassified Halomonas]|uniref:phage holin family protein n=1 Tax=unclassified Halomonas TaxID=2609666 RepID=UPI0028871D34|nr:MULTISPECIES: phage holin family protein [unclassified Halomonas]MDT0502370.1 phage holin family protein [Halomonas sp. PAR7]MDT0510911.1 phage holin family protein [Halomonas sp. LES1]MDT0592765.1 phage holin family protein [Halomonas sp. PAR8]